MLAPAHPTDGDALARTPGDHATGVSRLRLHGVRALVLGAVALAALTLIAPSSPTYDPWAWIIWGREVAHLDLVTTTGPSWKPLPVLFTTVFSLFGEAAPLLWLLIARAGAIAGVLVAYLLGRELGAGRLGAGAGAVALATAPWWTVNGWLGNSEGLLVALGLGACLLHLRGQERWAFRLAIAAALLRPEAWPFVGLYGLWLARRREQRLTVAVGLALLPLLWLVPERLGSGDWFRAATRAQLDLTPGNAARAEHPAREILHDFVHLLPLGVWIAIGALALAAIVGPYFSADSRISRPRVGALAVIAAGWVGAVAFEATRGYSGNQRYLIAPAAIALVLAGVGAAAALRLLPRVLQPLAALGIVATFALSGLADTIDAVPETKAQSRIPGDLKDAVQRAGGVDRLLACGPLVTEPLLIPQVAWRFGVHVTEVFYAPTPGPDAAVLRAQVSPELRPYPPESRYEGQPQKTLATAPRWQILVVGRCA